jgi:hypothetical protein
MGYSSDTAGGSDETLYLSSVLAGGSGASQGLAKFDASLTLVPIGPFSDDLLGRDAELTGTGDGALFGYFTTSPVQIARIDRLTGATSDAVTMTGLDPPDAWAFSFWGGEFYLYSWHGAANRTSTVTHYVPSTREVDNAYMGDVGFIIVGAGVSTCAPTTPPTPAARVPGGGIGE